MGPELRGLGRGPSGRVLYTRLKDLHFVLCRVESYRRFKVLSRVCVGSGGAIICSVFLKDHSDMCANKLMGEKKGNKETSQPALLAQNPGDRTVAERSLGVADTEVSEYILLNEQAWVVTELDVNGVERRGQENNSH